MSYAQYGLIEASDFNNLVGSATNNGNTAAVNTLNAVWATGNGAAGYGQTAVSQVSAGATIAATAWNSLVTNTSNSASHQGSSITAVTAPSAGDTITYRSAIPTNLSTIYTNRLNAASQSGTSSNAVTTTTTFNNFATFTHTATFANADAARHFFNAGGQLKITVAQTVNSTAIDQMFVNLCSNVGTVVVSSLGNSSTVSINGSTFNGVTKVGGGGNSPTIDATKGYYGLTTANANIFTQVTSQGPSGYLNSFIRVIAKTNGTQGANNDNGTVVTIYTIFDEDQNGYAVSAGSRTTLTVTYPTTTYLANTWGTVTLSGSVATANI